MDLGLARTYSESLGYVFHWSAELQRCDGCRPHADADGRSGSRNFTAPEFTVAWEIAR